MGLRAAVLRCDQAMGELGSILHDSAVRQQDRCQTDTCHAPQSRLRMGQERLCKDRLADAVRGKKVHWLYRRFDDAVEATELARDPPNGLGAVRTCDAVRLPRLSPRRGRKASRLGVSGRTPRVRPAWLLGLEPKGLDSCPPRGENDADRPVSRAECAPEPRRTHFPPTPPCTFDCYAAWSRLRPCLACSGR